MNMTRRIGNTVYNVKVTIADDDPVGMEEWILRMIQKEPLASARDRGIMNVPPTSCQQPERIGT